MSYWLLKIGNRRQKVGTLGHYRFPMIFNKGEQLEFIEQCINLAVWR